MEQADSILLKLFVMLFMIGITLFVPLFISIVINAFRSEKIKFRGHMGLLEYEVLEYVYYKSKNILNICRGRTNGSDISYSINEGQTISSVDFKGIV